jgi:hypothetical protein
MKEHAVSFGSSGQLSGILTEPVSPRPNAPAVLLWNIGTHHRVGTSRIWVELARRLARDGFTSLRFDLSGMGDSEPRRGGEADLSRQRDLDDAMAFVTKRTGIATFAPIGFCSGVDQLHPLGLRDERVVAMGYVEGYAWKTLGWRLRYPLRYLSLPRWEGRLALLHERKALEGLKAWWRPTRLGLDPGALEQAGGAEMFSRHQPEQRAFAADLRTLLRRGVKLFFAYFGLDARFTHASQFEEMTGVAPGGGLRLFFLGGADHLLIHVEDRALTITEIASWLVGSFG